MTDYFSEGRTPQFEPHPKSDAPPANDVRGDPPEDLVIRSKRSYYVRFACEAFALGAILLAVGGTEGRSTFFVGIGMVTVGILLFVYPSCLPVSAIFSPIGVVTLSLRGKNEIRWRDVTAVNEVWFHKTRGFVVSARWPHGRFIATSGTDTSQDQIRDYIRKYRPDLFEPHAPLPPPTPSAPAASSPPPPAR